MPSDGVQFPPKIPATIGIDVYCETLRLPNPSSFPFQLLPLIPNRRRLGASLSPLRQSFPRSWKIVSSSEVVKSKLGSNDLFWGKWGFVEDTEQSEQGSLLAAPRT
ncbi:hypothetical protein MRB53_024042 [Persea americana]|uniref:Uncharacterized protein n=1 Tax=Persea americana TaxID=3435 RepID=A0ACC2LCF5_PERAE|nr:hypothetical protein MRB53_024042 [Persea americana]